MCPPLFSLSLSYVSVKINVEFQCCDKYQTPYLLPALYLPDYYVRPCILSLLLLALEPTF